MQRIRNLSFLGAQAKDMNKCIAKRIFTDSSINKLWTQIIEYSQDIE